MKTYLKQLRFDSTQHTYIKNITDIVRETVKQARVNQGFVIISSKHTTLGIIVHEIAEPNLLEDILQHSLASELLFPELYVYLK